jgi:AraC-like DNA-binding protein
MIKRESQARHAPLRPSAGDACMMTRGAPTGFQAARASPDPAFRGLSVEMPRALTIAMGEGAGHEVWTLGPFALSRITGPSGRYVRGAAQIARDLLDHWVLCVAPSGLHKLHAGGTAVTVAAGEPFILSLSKPFEGERDDADWLCLFIPRDSFPELSPAIDRCCHLPLASVPGRLLGGFLRQLAAEMPTLQDAEMPRAVEAIRALVTAAVAGGVVAQPMDEAHVQEARLARIRAIMRQHLRSPELTPAWLCRLADISRSQLYRLFEPVGGVAHEIQRERLREAHRAIADPTDGRSIREIGEELGFPEPTTFSRAFRREFGYPPSRLRQATPRAPDAAALAGPAPDDEAPPPP